MRFFENKKARAGVDLQKTRQTTNGYKVREIVKTGAVSATPQYSAADYRETK